MIEGASKDACPIDGCTCDLDSALWIPTLYNASSENRRKFEVSQDRRMIIWDPEKSGINDEINLIDYLGPTRVEEDGSLLYPDSEKRKQIAEAKTKMKKKK
jgi:hypothetical protein